jgi:hypothetical protein
MAHKKRRFFPHELTRFAVHADGRALTAGEAFEAELTLKLPRRSAPSLVAGDHRVEWELEVRVDVANWPDWVHTYPIQVLPAGLAKLEGTERVAPTVQAGQTCPFCRDAVRGHEALTTCAGCTTTYHLECMRECGRCATRGCGRSERRRV